MSTTRERSDDLSLRTPLRAISFSHHSIANPWSPLHSLGCAAQTSEEKIGCLPSKVREERGHKDEKNVRAPQCLPIRMALVVLLLCSLLQLHLTYFFIDS